MATRLQISQEDRLRILQDRINQYDIRFPVAELSDKLNADMGNVSSMLSGKKPISDKFFTNFCETYPEKEKKDYSPRIEDNSIVEDSPMSYGQTNYFEEAFKLLKEQNLYLKKLIDVNLAGLSRDVNNNSSAIRAEVRGYGKYQLLKQSNWDDQEFAKAMAVVDKIYGEELKADDGQGSHGR